jgi:cytochrome P450
MQLFDDLEDFGSFDDAVSGDVRDPYAELALMRREGAVQRLDLSGMPHDASKPVFMVYRYDEIAQVLRDNETFSSSIIIAFFGDALGKHVMLGMDEPAHRRYRSLVSAAFSRKALARRQDELSRGGANDLIDRFAERARDLVREFTFPYPTQIIAGLLGLPREDHPQFQRLVHLAAQHHRQPERAVAASRRCGTASLRFAARRTEPRTTHQPSRAGRDRGERLSDEEIFSFLRLLAPAGVETTYRSMGNLLFRLPRTRSARRARGDRSLIPQAIEEAVRWRRRCSSSRAWPPETRSWRGYRSRLARR